MSAAASQSVKAQRFQANPVNQRPCISEAMFHSVRSAIRCEISLEQRLETYNENLVIAQANLDRAAKRVSEYEIQLLAARESRISVQGKVRAAFTNSTLSISCLSDHLKILCLQVAGTAERQKLVMANRAWNRVINEGYQQRFFEGLDGTSALSLAIEVEIGFEDWGENDTVGALVLYQPAGNRITHKGLLQKGKNANELIQMPVGTALNGAALCTFRDQIVIAGGMPGSQSQSTKSVNMWSAATHKWIKRSPMNHHRSKHQLLVVGSELWAMGGMVSAEPVMEWTSNILDSIEVYNSRTDAWRIASSGSLPEQLHSFGAAFDGQRILVVGGVQWRGGNKRSRTELHSFVSGACYYKPARLTKPNQRTDWCMLPELLHPVCNCSLGTVNGKIIVAGGCSAVTLLEPEFPSRSEILFDSPAQFVQIFDWTSDSWQDANIMPRPQFGIAPLLSFSASSSTRQVLSFIDCGPELEDFAIHEYDVQGNTWIEQGVQTKESLHKVLQRAVAKLRPDNTCCDCDDPYCENGSYAYATFEQCIGASMLN